MSNKILNDLPILIEKGIVTKDIADKIKAYYYNVDTDSKDKLQIALAVLGALLVGLGILLILAHNWDTLPKSVKTVFAFIPLVVSQMLIVFVILKKQNDRMWKESVGVFNFIAIAISISLVSQIYHINGELDDFMLTWMLLALPIIYILRSSMGSLLYIGGVTVFVANTSYVDSSQYPKSFLYLPLLMLIIPYYMDLLKRQKHNNFTYFHNWVIPLSAMFSFPMIIRGSSELIPLIFYGAFTLIYFIGKTNLLKYNNLIKNAYIVIAVFGIMVMLYIISFEDYWRSLSIKDPYDMFSLRMIFTSAIILFDLVFMFKSKLSYGFNFDPIEWVFILFSTLFILSVSTNLNPLLYVVLINVFIFLTGVSYVFKGEKQNDLITLNIGILILSILIIVRFFDFDISFLIRGFVFILMGIVFFIANFLLIRKRKKSEA